MIRSVALVILLSCLAALTLADSAELYQKQWQGMTRDQRLNALSSMDEEQAKSLMEALPQEAQERISTELADFDETDAQALLGDVSDSDDPGSRKTVAQFQRQLLGKSTWTKWDMSEVKRVVTFAYASYCKEGDQVDWSCKWCKGMGTHLFVTTTFLKKDTNTAGYVGWNEKCGTDCRLVAAFRGTQGSSWKNWKTNLDAVHSDNYAGMTGANVHLGFYNAFLGIKNTFRKGLADAFTKMSKKCTSPCAKLTVTGHSLGGALATLAVSDLLINNGVHPDQDNSKITLYTYGSPRVGNSVFAHWFNSKMHGRSWRFTNYEDLIPHMPKEDMGYHHIATEVWNSAPDSMTGKWNTCDGSGEDPKCSNSAWSTSIDDHLDYFHKQEAWDGDTARR